MESRSSGFQSLARQDWTIKRRFAEVNMEIIRQIGYLCQDGFGRSIFEYRDKEE